MLFGIIKEAETFTPYIMKSEVLHECLQGEMVKPVLYVTLYSKKKKKITVPLRLCRIEVRKILSCWFLFTL